MNTGGGRPFSGRGSSLLFPVLMVATLFFIRGFCQTMLDVLNKHFQNILHVS
jgi:FHS family L-fucose permease-like MFS transporter